MTDIVFPEMNKESPEAVGVVSTWYANEGEQVAVAQLVADVQMDKVDAEVDSPRAGVIHIAVEEGAEVAQGSVIATVE